MWNEPLGEYQVLVLPRDRYPEPRPLPEGFSFINEVPRSVERELLGPEFTHWQIPYERRFPGAREDSLLAVAKGELIVGISYLGADNRIGLSNYGEAHYMVTRPEFRGLGLTFPRFTRRLERATSWGLAGLVMVSNREGIPELYERWGALRVGTLKPVSRASRIILGRFVSPDRRMARRAAAVLREHGASTPSSEP